MEKSITAAAPAPRTIGRASDANSLHVLRHRSRTFLNDMMQSLIVAIYPLLKANST